MLNAVGCYLKRKAVDDNGDRAVLEPRFNCFEIPEKFKSFFGQGRSGDVPIVDGDAHENVSHRTAHNVSRIACAVENFNRSIDL